MSRSRNSRKPKHELQMARVQYLLAILAVIHIVAFVFGALLGFGYLVRHHFNPGGISGADSLAMMLWSLGFLLVLTLGLGCSTLAGLALGRFIGFAHAIYRHGLLWFKRHDHFPKTAFWWSLMHGSPNRLEWHSRQGGLVLTGWVMLALFCAGAAVAPLDLRMFLVTILVPGIFISMNVFGKMVESFSPFPRRLNQSALDIRMSRLSVRKRSIIITAVIIALTTVLCLGTWLDASAVIIGFREQDVNVRLSKDDFEEVLAEATRSGLAINPCEQLTPGVTTLQHADILWQNLGTRSLMRFPSQPLGVESAGIEVRFKTKSTAIENVVSAVQPHRCGEILSDLVFADNQRVRSNAGARILQQLPWLNKLSASSRLRIVVYGGKAPSTTGTSTETMRQAAVVKQIVASLTMVPTVAIEAVSGDPVALKQPCEKRSGGQRVLCETSNRRIEIHVVDTI
jgi:hypothetical protein